MVPLPDRDDDNCCSVSSSSDEIVGGTATTGNGPIKMIMPTAVVDSNPMYGDTTTTTTTTKSNSHKGLFLRWSRISKIVTVKADNSGLLRGSITASAAPTKGPSVKSSLFRRITTHHRNHKNQVVRGNNGSSATTRKTILDEVSGFAAPGEILAMMGPSGSGKTSLLNCLSGRNPFNSGVLSVNGRPLSGKGPGSDMKRLMAKIAYVRQADIFFDHLTVRDQLGYTAVMRLPQELDHSKKMDEVNRIIRLLRLTKVADSKIQMLSGGEKKRVNIGTELLTDPSVLLLDEPTSGLDSTSAVALVRMLRKLCRTSNKTIITSIHQPSSALFASFDRLIMLAEGHVVYFGPPRDSLLYLKQQGLDCPVGYNGADHWMDLLVQDSALDDDEEKDEDEDDIENSNRQNHHNPNCNSKNDICCTDNPDDTTNDTIKNVAAGTTTSSSVTSETMTDEEITTTSTIRNNGSETRQRLIRAWDNESIAAQIDLHVEKQTDDNNGNGNKRLSFLISHSIHSSRKSFTAAASTIFNNNKSNDKTKNVVEKEPSKYNTSWGLQYRTLVHRSMKNSRSAIFTPINLIKSCAIGLLSGLLWFQMTYTESRVFDLSSYFFFTMTFWVFDAMFQSFLCFPAERAVILKERSSGSYRLSAYFMGKTTSEMPARLVLPMIYMTISFWMAGVSKQFSMFIATTFISLLSVMAGEAIGLVIGATIYDMDKGMTFMTVISLLLMLVGGFFVENVPSFLKWAKFLSPFKYSFDASLQLVFKEPVPCDGSGALEEICGGYDTGYAQPEQVIQYLGVQGSIGFNVGILIMIGLVPRYVAYLALRSKKEGDR